MSAPTILAFLAHPDDEVFGSGGTFARAAAEGSRVVLVCATRGEVGEISDPALATPETLGDVREQELHCSAAALGISEVIFLDYHDSGMAGTDANADPRAFINAPAETVIERLVTIIRAERPEIVVTFDPTGGYGHPDHISIHHHTLAAVHAAPDPAVAPDTGPPWQVSRVCYVAIARSSFRAIRDVLAELGEDTSTFDAFEEMGAGAADEDLHIVVDIGQFIDAKQVAFDCHRTQFGGDSIFDRIPEEVMRSIMSREHFSIGWPAPPEPGTILASLSDGL